MASASESNRLVVADLSLVSTVCRWIENVFAITSRQLMLCCPLPRGLSIRDEVEEEAMAATELQNRGGVRIATDLIDEFAAGLAGRLIRPADADYDEARQIWNAAIEFGLERELPMRWRCPPQNSWA
jgi:hypothetical protein